jgi:hypothetical protein
MTPSHSNRINSSTKDPEVAAFLKTGPVLGAHKPIHEQRVEHNAFIDKVKPLIGKIEHLVLDDIIDAGKRQAAKLARQF